MLPSHVDRVAVVLVMLLVASASAWRQVESFSQPDPHPEAPVLMLTLTEHQVEWTGDTGLIEIKHQDTRIDQGALERALKDATARKAVISSSDHAVYDQLLGVFDALAHLGFKEISVEAE